MKTVSVARNFTRFPSGRHKAKGSTSGEEFRQTFLEPALRSGERIEVDLDGTLGYGSSFLEEAFGGLVRSLELAPDRLFDLLTIKSEDPLIIQEVRNYVLEAWTRKNS
jgi:hypothetical protein